MRTSSLLVRILKQQRHNAWSESGQYTPEVGKVQEMHGGNLRAGFAVLFAPPRARIMSRRAQDSGGVPACQSAGPRGRAGMPPIGWYSGQFD